MSYIGLLKIVTRSPDEFLKIVKRDSGNIPMSIRMFLGDAIRNALCVPDKTELTNRISSALKEVGI